MGFAFGLNVSYSFICTIRIGLNDACVKFWTHCQSYCGDSYYTRPPNCLARGHSHVKARGFRSARTPDLQVKSPTLYHWVTQEPLQGYRLMFLAVRTDKNSKSQHYFGKRLVSFFIGGAHMYYTTKNVQSGVFDLDRRLLVSMQRLYCMSI